MHDKQYLSRLFFQRTDKHGPEIRAELGVCWLWTGYINAEGYGNVLIKGGKHVLAHRLSYLLHNDDFDEKLYILHKCDNPTCVNPSHLFQGTAKDNFYDAVSKGRIKPETWQRPAPRKVTAELEDKIVELNKAGVKHSEIAEQIGVSRECVSKYSRQNGFLKNLTKEDKEFIKSKFEEGLSNVQIANLLGREQSTIRKFRNKLYGVKEKVLNKNQVNKEFQGLRLRQDVLIQERTGV